MSKEDFTCKFEVRNYEVDYQGIVNNACYFHYLDHARAKYLEALGVNVKEYADNDINIVLVETNLLFKKSLTFGNSVHVATKFEKQSRFKFAFDQKIFLEPTNELILESVSLVCCVNSKTGKPCVIKEFESF